MIAVTMTQPGYDEPALVREACAGDKVAFEALVRAFAPRVWRTAVRMVGVSDAPDAVQDAFVSAYRGLGRFRVGEPFGPWLMAIATNTCLNALRSRRRAPVPVETLPATALDDPEREVQRREQERLVQAAITRLADVPRAVVVLHYTEGYGCAQIGDMLGMTEGAVKVALFRARGRLRELLRKDDADAM